MAGIELGFVFPGIEGHRPANRTPTRRMPGSDTDPMTQLSQTEDTALVLFSGGQDSTTCLAWALARYRHVETVGFRYGQRHAVEMDCREPIRQALASARLGIDHVVDLTATIGDLGQTAMTADIALQMDQ